MNRAVLVCTLCAALSSSWLENAHAQLRSEDDSGTIIQSIEALSKVVKGLQTEIKMQSSVLSNLVSKEELESILLSNLATKSDMQMQETSFKNLEAKAAMNDNLLSNLGATVDELKTLLINLNVKENEPVTSLKTLEAESKMQTFLLHGTNFENQTSLLNNPLTNEEVQMNDLPNVEAKATTFANWVETLAEGIQNSTGSKGTVEGIIAGTTDSVVIIPLDSRNQTTISTTLTNGVAFNWQSRKVYWIDYGVGIRTADLDGSNAELLVSGSIIKYDLMRSLAPRLVYFVSSAKNLAGSFLYGLAVDQITGNFYYGYAALLPPEIEKSKASIRVCDSMGKKCATVVSGVNIVGMSIWDIALHPSEGSMFWSSPHDKKSVTQANMDGTNASVIALETVYGLYLDDFTEKLYWANDNGKSIRRYDLNGDSHSECGHSVQLNSTIYPNDIAVDGDTLYFSSNDPIGVYSVTISGNVSSISNTTEHVDHIALYGRNKVFSRSNPCENSPCANLCVLTRDSYTCL